MGTRKEVQRGGPKEEVLRRIRLHDVVVKEIQPRNVVVRAKGEQVAEKLTRTERKRERGTRKSMVNVAGAPVNSSAARWRWRRASANSLTKLQARESRARASELGEENMMKEGCSGFYSQGKREESWGLRDARVQG